MEGELGYCNSHWLDETQLRRLLPHVCASLAARSLHAVRLAVYTSLVEPTHFCAVVKLTTLSSLNLQNLSELIKIKDVRSIGGPPVTHENKKNYTF
ncbi:hypothetical protein EVAR_10123_1 [Eumeta japonica]|uniref:Uncharacterized protein n=1 Tax=Eumeta variegata TaxID=151549 RepID=A0A4C1UDH7_EUMVA|nr:hypothetical protein EVAR_10123_1 [Eumeta japonica]